MENSKEILSDLTNNFDGIEFIGEEITEEQRITIHTILNNEENLKKKISYWLYNYNFMGLASPEELFYNFLCEFRMRPNWAFDYYYSDDENYNPYYYIVSRLKYFLNKLFKEFKLKLDSEIRIFEQEDTTDLPSRHIPINVIEKNKNEVDNMIGLLDLDNVMDEIRGFERDIDFPVLDMFLVELDATLNSKSLRIGDLVVILNNDRVSEIKKMLKQKTETNLNIKDLISSLVLICNENALDIFDFCRVEL